MRLNCCKRLSILAWVFSTFAAQVSWDPQPTLQSTTLVDVLNADEDYSLLLPLLQRARLIPTLNKLNGSTLFAPTNDAVKHHAKQSNFWHSLLVDDYSRLPDNVQEQLRQQLLYHLLNYSVIQLPEGSSTEVLKTLHFPHSGVDPPAPEPWLPSVGGTLGGEPQRLRLASRDGLTWVGTDAFGKGGVQVVKERADAANGVVYGIAGVLETPPVLERTITSEKSLSYFQKVLNPEIGEFLNSTSELTLFMPVDSAWQCLDRLERLYLESDFAADDLRRIVDMHAVTEKDVKWSDSFQSSTEFTTRHGTILDIEVSSEGTTISGAELVLPDIYASNGVLHLVSSLLLPPGALRLTPEKYLLALNCTSFVSLLHSVNLTHLINSTDKKYTILAPNDDVLSLFIKNGLPASGSAELKRMLKYHFIPGLWTPKKLDHGMLLETELREVGLDDGRQVLQIEVHDREMIDAQLRHVTFGGAGVIGEHVEIENTIIYFISRPLDPPVDPLQTALPSLDLSSFLAAIFSTSLAEVIKKTPRTTFLIPRNSAFKRLGHLVSDHLLAASSKSDLENVILHHIIDSVEYSKALVNGSQRTFATLEGSDLQLERTENGTVIISASGGWAGMKTALYPRNLFTKTGVIHELSDLIIPRSVDLNIGKLMKAGKATTMTNMVVKAGFDWILNGTEPPEGSEWADKGLSGASWTLLCPTDDAFKKLNLSQLLEDPDVLRSIVRQHLIPMPPSLPITGGLNAFDLLDSNRPLPLDGLETYSTLLSSSSAYGDIVFREREDKAGEYMLGIRNARGTDGKADWARVLAWGRATTGGGTGGVIQIDQLLIPYHPPWWIEYGAPSFVGVVGVILICLFFYGVRIVWNRDTTEATYEPSSEAPAVEETKRSALENAKSFIAGGFGGVSAVLVGHPFDLTKTRLQTATPGQYTGAVDVVRKTLARDGITGMYRGMVPPLLGVTPIFAVSFWAYDAAKQLIFALTPDRATGKLSTAELATAGFLSAVPTTLVTAPVERAKVLLQVQGQGSSGTQYKGVLDVLKHLYKEGGIRSIYRGTGATLARDGPGSAAYFVAYEVTKTALTPVGPSHSELNLGAIILAGGTAGVAMWSLAIPPDVLKSRLQSAPSGAYTGLFDCFRKTVVQDGVTALWRGFGPAMARAFPANAATFLGVEASRKLMDSLVEMSKSTAAAKRMKPRGHQRSFSASEIARNMHHFETWSTCQHCELVSFSDIPGEFKDDMEQLFGVRHRLSKLWFEKPETCSEGLAAFLKSAFEAAPDLFSTTAIAGGEEILEDISVVYLAWKRLRKMRSNSEKWSEAEYAANVYNVFRSPAIRESAYRVQCTVSLPQPLTSAGDDALRILNTKTATPDCGVFLPASLARRLSHSAKSPYKVLKNHPEVAKEGTVKKGSSFRYQSTPRAQPPEMPGFEFVSSLWEDKKPVHTLLDDAYRQNRIATASAARHLHSLNIKSPVIGLIWTNGTVQAHIDWCEAGSPNGVCLQVVMSAPYSALEGRSEFGRPFHDWVLDNPCDILRVYFVIRNIDQWTCGRFHDRIVAGLKNLVKSITHEEGSYHPWKWDGSTTLAVTSGVLKENNSLSVTTTTSGVSSPPPRLRNSKRRKRRSSH
ncbi:hypothetical protein F5I97DRAFT_1809627 [Phlebopus sp. FC_14]|nr:hypothetical protein F5I97DRAFT_1809627 [Phlebopus sp. FC_14]